MKKLISLVATIALFTLLFSSCKSHEQCPAYGKTTSKVQNHQPA